MNILARHALMHMRHSSSAFDCFCTDSQKTSDTLAAKGEKTKDNDKSVKQKQILDNEIANKRVTCELELWDDLVSRFRSLNEITL